MVNTISTQILNDGRRNTVVKVNILGDATGDETDTALFDVSTFSEAPSEVKIRKVWSAFDAFTVTLAWDATANVDAVTMSGESDMQDFSKFGGLINNAGAGKTGDILLNTNGLGVEEGFFIVWMQKS